MSASLRHRARAPDRRFRLRELTDACPFSVSVASGSRKIKTQPSGSMALSSSSSWVSDHGGPKSWTGMESPDGSWLRAPKPQGVSDCPSDSDKTGRKGRDQGAGMHAMRAVPVNLKGLAMTLRSRYRPCRANKSWRQPEQVKKEETRASEAHYMLFGQVERLDLDPLEARQGLAAEELVRALVVGPVGCRQELQLAQPLVQPDLAGGALEAGGRGH